MMSRLNKFTFQDHNAQPAIDSKNRIVVTFLYGLDQAQSVNTEKASEEAIRSLIAIPNTEVTGKGVRLRVSRDIDSVYPNELMVETADGHYVGWIRNDVWLTNLLLTVSEEILGFVPENAGYVYDFWAQVSGVYFEENLVDENGDEYFYWDLSVEIRFKYPLEIDILSRTP